MKLKLLRIAFHFNSLYVEHLHSTMLADEQVAYCARSIDISKRLCLDVLKKK